MTTLMTVEKYEKAEAEAKKLWEAMVAADDAPAGFPPNPDVVFAVEWRGWQDWIEFVKDLPKSANTLADWRCSKGHVNETTPRDLIASGFACPACKKEEADALIPRNGLAPAKWKCGKGHEFTASYFQVRAGFECPTCKVRA